MIVYDEYDPSCMNRHCDSPRTMNGFLCAECNRKRYGTIHANWESASYLRWMQGLERRLEQQAASRRRAAERRRAA